MSGGTFEVSLPVDLLMYCLQNENAEQRIVLNGSCQKQGGREGPSKPLKVEDVQVYAERIDKKLALSFCASEMGSVFQKKLNNVWCCQIQSLVQDVTQKPDPEWLKQDTELDLDRSTPILTTEVVPKEEETPSAQPPLENAEKPEDTAGIENQAADIDVADISFDVNLEPLVSESVPAANLPDSVVCDETSTVDIQTPKLNRSRSDSSPTFVPSYSKIMTRSSGKKSRKRAASPEPKHTPKAKRARGRPRADPKRVCTVCKCVLGSQEELVQHCKDHHLFQKVTKGVTDTEESLQTQTEEKRCTYCNKNSFPSVKSLKKHLRTCASKPEVKAESTPKPYKCDHCGKQTATEGGLFRHMKKVHQVQKEKKSQKNDELEQELKSTLSASEKVEDLVCRFCQRSWFTSQRAFVNHFHKCSASTKKGSTEGTDGFTCDMCNTKFIKEETLKRHHRVAHGIENRKPSSVVKRKKKKPPPAPCQYCGKIFEWRLSRIKHEKFKCASNPNVAKAHYCSICNKIFSTKEEVVAHLAAVHPNGVEFVCPLCGMVFKSRSGFYFHKLRVHNEDQKPKFQCPLCPMAFLTRMRMLSHKTKHFDNKDCICELCGKGFKNDAQVKNHIKAVHLNRYAYHCERCGHGVQKKEYLDSHVCGRVRRVQKQNLPQDFKGFAVETTQVELVQHDGVEYQEYEVQHFIDGEQVEYIDEAVIESSDTVKTEGDIEYSEVQEATQYITVVNYNMPAE